MSASRDPLESLRDANPVPPEDAPSPETPQARALLERIVRIPPEAPPARRRSIRVRAWVLVPVALLAVAAGSYAWVREVREPLVVACYGRPSLAVSPAVVPATGGSPEAACALLWRPGGPFTSGGRPPELTACVLSSGVIGVFPSIVGKDTCPALGLARPGQDPAEASYDRLVQGMQGRLTDTFVNACIDRTDAVATAQAELADDGLDDEGWVVVSRVPFSSISPCASIDVDVPGRTISIIPSSNPSPSP